MMIMLELVGYVESLLIDRVLAFKQGYEGVLVVWIWFELYLVGVFDGMQVGDRLFLFMWLDCVDCSMFKVYLCSNFVMLLQGVFSMCLFDRLNLIGLYFVIVFVIDGVCVQVDQFEVFDGMLVVDVKFVI